VLPQGLAAAIELSAMEMPPVFSWLAEQGKIAQGEMLKTFNCGTGMIAVVSAREADDIMLTLAASGETVTRLGEIVERPARGRAVTYRGRLKI